MMRALVVISGAVLALGLCDAWLVLRERSARAGDVRVGALFTPAEAEELRKLPALRVESAGTTHRYGRIEGRWRCISYRDAPADERAIQSLIDALVQAEGFVVTREVEDAPAFGINAPETMRVALQGPRAVQDPGGDVQVEVDVGRSVPERGVTYLRRKGTKEIWEVDGDVRAMLAGHGALPPLLEPSVVPAAWLEDAGGVLGVEIGEESRLVLERRDQAFDAEALERGARPWQWFVRGDPAATERELDADVGTAYASWLEHLPYEDVLDPSRRAELVPENGSSTVVLRGRAGTELRLAFGPPLGDGRVPLWGSQDSMLFLLAAGARELALPTADVLLGATREENPWSAALAAGGR
jgi:hypothetical protein